MAIQYADLYLNVPPGTSGQAVSGQIVVAAAEKLYLMGFCASYGVNTTAGVFTIAKDGAVVMRRAFVGSTGETYGRPIVMTAGTYVFGVTAGSGQQASLSAWGSKP